MSCLVGDISLLIEAPSYLIGLPSTWQLAWLDADRRVKDRAS